MYQNSWNLIFQNSLPISGDFRKIYQHPNEFFIIETKNKKKKSQDFDPENFYYHDD